MLSTDGASTVSEGYVHKLRELHSILTYRAETAKGVEKYALSAQAQQLLGRIKKHEARTPNATFYGAIAITSHPSP